VGLFVSLKEFVGGVDPLLCHMIVVFHSLHLLFLLYVCA
jgi:hypothetical protein